MAELTDPAAQHAWLAHMGAMCADIADLVVACDVVSEPGGEWDADLTAVSQDGDVDTTTWLAEATAYALLESAGLFRAIGNVLSSADGLSDVGLYAVGGLVRSIVERCGFVMWLLESGITADERDARVAHYTSYSHFLRREAARNLKAPSDVLKAAKEALHAEYAMLEQRYGVVQEQDDDGHDERDPSKWKVRGEYLPGLSKLTRIAFDKSAKKQAMGIYDVLSGLTHPSPGFAAESFVTTGPNVGAFRPDADKIERLVRIGIGTFFDAVDRWVQYYNRAPEPFQDKKAAAVNLLQQITVLPPDADGSI